MLKTGIQNYGGPSTTEITHPSPLTLPLPEGTLSPSNLHCQWGTFRNISQYSRPIYPNTQYNDFYKTRMSVKSSAPEAKELMSEGIRVHFSVMSEALNFQLKALLKLNFSKDMNYRMGPVLKPLALTPKNPNNSDKPTTTRNVASKCTV